MSDAPSRNVSITPVAIDQMSLRRRDTVRHPKMKVYNISLLAWVRANFKAVCWSGAAAPVTGCWAMSSPSSIPAMRLVFGLLPQVQPLLARGLFTAIDVDVLTSIKCVGCAFVKVQVMEAARSGIVAASRLLVLWFRIDRPRRPRVPNLPGG